MGSRIAWPLAVTAVALTLTAGCGGKASPSPEASGAAASTPTASPAPSTTGFPTSSTPAIDPNIPAAARAHTPAGAEAFARYYVEQINSVGLKPRGGELQRLSGADCKSCANYESTMRAMQSNRQHYSANIFLVRDISVGATTGSGGSRVAVDVEQQPVRVLNIDGTTDHVVKAASAQLQYDLIWTKNGWRIAESYVALRKS